jgi:hypothetical protein
MEKPVDNMDCGGKRSATPLWHGDGHPVFVHQTTSESGVAAALCHRSPKLALNLI